MKKEIKYYVEKGWVRELDNACISYENGTHYDIGEEALEEFECMRIEGNEYKALYKEEFENDEVINSKLIIIQLPKENE